MNQKSMSVRLTTDLSAGKERPKTGEGKGQCVQKQ